MATTGVLNDFHQGLHRRGEVFAVQSGLGIGHSVEGAGDGAVNFLTVVIGVKGQEVRALGPGYIDDLNVLSLGNGV